VIAHLSFPHPITQHQNLTVITETRVARILIDHKMAEGVEYFKDGELQIIKATKEVIVSAGTFCSPQLLMLSGIGPKGL
jgi:choline dehydrogenase